MEINPISQTEFEKLINTRLTFYRSNNKVFSPIEAEVFLYLYEITRGRLRYIFGLLQRLISKLHVGDLTDKLTLDIAKPMITQLARSRISRNKLSLGEENVLKLLVEMKGATISDLAKASQKSTNYTSNLLSKLVQLKLVSSQKQGKSRFCIPELDAIIAFGN